MTTAPLCPPFHSFTLRTPECTYTLWREGEIAEGVVVLAELDYRETDAEGHVRHVESAVDRHTEQPLPNDIRIRLNSLCLCPEQPETDEERPATMELLMNGRLHTWEANTPTTRRLFTELHGALYALLPELHNCRAAAPQGQ